VGVDLGRRAGSLDTGSRRRQCSENTGYSVRKAVIGVTRMARRAGRKQASNAAPPNNTLAV